MHCAHGSYFYFITIFSFFKWKIFYVNSIFSHHKKRNKKQFFPKLNFIEQFVWQRCRCDTKLRQTRKIDIYFCWRCDAFILHYSEKIHCEAQVKTCLGLGHLIFSSFLSLFSSIFENFDWIYRETLLSLMFERSCVFQ